MIVIPAIDLLGGQCVRLLKGDYGSARQVSADPFAALESFAAAGAGWVHIVDLDGARAGKPVNGELILRLARSAKLKVEVGGGIRSAESAAAYLDGGVSRVILGSAALTDPELVDRCVSRWGGAVEVGIDAKDGYVRTSGWTEGSKTYFTDLALAMAGRGVKHIIFTDIDRDGALSGPDLAQTGELVKALDGKAKVTASGGVRDLRDIEALRGIGVYAAIAGKAVYSGSLDLRAAVAAAAEGEEDKTC